MEDLAELMNDLLIIYLSMNGIEEKLARKRYVP